MFRLFILTILFISSFSFGTINKNLDKMMENSKNITSESVVTNQATNEKQIQQENKQQTPVTTTKPSTSKPNNSNKTNQTQGNKNTTQTSENKQTQENKNPTSTPVPTATPKPAVQPFKCENNKHGIEAGNSGKWFDTEQQAINFYESEQDKWDNLLGNEEIDWDTYCKKCPYGYEDWTCPLCHKWTINLYYH